MKKPGKRNYRMIISLLTAVSLISIFNLELSAAESKKTVSTKTNAADITTIKPVYGGTLRVADQYDGVSIGYPPKMLRVNSSRQAAPAIETLFRIDKTGNTVPWLVETFKNNVKEKSVTLKLRKGIKFHDGTDFDAEAVKWNLDQAITAKCQGTEKFKSVDVLDSSTVCINLTQWDSTVTSNLSQTAGMIISPTAFKKNGQEWSAKNPIGTGPFEFVSWEKDVRTVYKKFEEYWQKGKPYLDGIVWTPIADQLTHTFSIKKGEIDVSMWISGKDAVGLEKEGFLITYGSAGSGTMALIPDSANSKSPFADVRVRQATRHAIDTESLVKTVYDGLAESANQWSYKNHWGYNRSVVGYPYNPSKAKKLLTEAGYPNGFKAKLGYRTNPLDDQVFTAIQSYLKAVGIDAELDPMMTGRYDQIAMQGGKWEGLIINAVSPNPDIAAALAARYAGGGPYFNSMLTPKDYVAAIQNAINAPDFKTKKKWTHEAMKLMIDKYCLQITISGRYPFSVSRAVVHNHNIMATPNAGGWTPEDTWIEK